MRRIVGWGVAVGALALIAGEATRSEAAVVSPAVRPRAISVESAGLPITEAAQVGPAPAVRAWSDCLVSTINRARATVGASPLKVDVRVSLAAFGHSLDQAWAQAVSHTDGSHTDGGDRLQAAGYDWSTWGENVAAGQGDCQSVTAAWLGSSTHRANILNPRFRDVGVGVAIGANGVPYWTMDLAAP